MSVPDILSVVFIVLMIGGAVFLTLRARKKGRCASCGNENCAACGRGQKKERRAPTGGEEKSARKEEKNTREEEKNTDGEEKDTGKEEKSGG